MNTILVPGPSKEAFNKHRRVSDLIKAQIAHFKHLEQKLPIELRRTIPQHPILTEDDAARYIAPMTKLLLSRRLLTVVPATSTAIKAKRTAASPRQKGLAIAAAADDSGSTTKDNAKRKIPAANTKRSK